MRQILLSTVILAFGYALTVQAQVSLTTWNYDSMPMVHEMFAPHLVDAHTAGTDGGMPLDDSKKSATVPEPAAWAVIVLGAGLLFGAQRLRRKKS